MGNAASESESLRIFVSKSSLTHLHGALQSVSVLLFDLRHSALHNEGEQVECALINTMYFFNPLTKPTPSTSLDKLIHI